MLNTMSMTRIYRLYSLTDEEILSSGVDIQYSPFLCEKAWVFPGEPPAIVFSGLHRVKNEGSI